jgi:hypothetical protein
MAKITIAGDAIVITSGVKLETIQHLEKYRPAALRLMGGEENKEIEFVIATAATGSLNNNGAVFASADEEGKAYITEMLPGGLESRKDYVSDKYGAALLKLNKLEATLATASDEVAAEKAKIAELIEVR